jgi:phosphoribosylformylglycinamidine synthase
MFGADIEISVKSRKDFSYFSETQSRIIVSISKDKETDFENYLRSSDQLFIKIGVAGGSHLKINNDINVKIFDLADIYFHTISRLMSGEK